MNLSTGIAMNGLLYMYLELTEWIIVTVVLSIFTENQFLWILLLSCTKKLKVDWSAIFTNILYYNVIGLFATNLCILETVIFIESTKIDTHEY